METNEFDKIDETPHHHEHGGHEHHHHHEGEHEHHHHHDEDGEHEHHHHHDEDGEHEHHHHHHEHGHHHHHHHSHELTSLSKAFVVGIMLNVLFVVAEAIAGWVSNSMGLLADAGHNLSDVASLLLALIAFRMAKRKASHHYTYGYKKSTVLVSLLNAIILMVAVVFIVYESVEQLLNPEPVGGKVIVITAAIGVVINGLTAYLFIDKKDKDLNVKGAYLHMAADALVSVGVVVSGVVIYFTGWYFIDGIIGLIVAVIIIVSTWDLLKDSMRLAMDGVPASIDTLRLTNDICKIEGVEEIHHLHVWAISTTETAATAHVVTSNMPEMQRIKTEIKHTMADFGIGHATLEFEEHGCVCGEHDHC